MKKHNTFVIQFLKKHGNSEMVDLWCSVENQQQFQKIRQVKEGKKRRCTCYILFCIQRRQELQKEFPHYPNTHITSLLAKEWRQHRDSKDEIYFHFINEDKKNLLLTES